MGPPAKEGHDLPAATRRYERGKEGFLPNILREQAARLTP